MHFSECILQMQRSASCNYYAYDTTLSNHLQPEICKPCKNSFFTDFVNQIPFIGLFCHLHSCMHISSSFFNQYMHTFSLHPAFPFIKAFFSRFSLQNDFFALFAFFSCKKCRDCTQFALKLQSSLYIDVYLCFRSDPESRCSDRSACSNFFSPRNRCPSRNATIHTRNW